jgi:hypothetical protein
VEGVEDGGVELVHGAIVRMAAGIELVLDLAGLGEIAEALVVAGVVDAEANALDLGALAEASGGHDVLAGGYRLTHGAGSFRRNENKTPFILRSSLFADGYRDFPGKLHIRNGMEVKLHKTKGMLCAY